MSRFYMSVALAMGLAVATMAPVAAAAPSETITGSVGENVSTTDPYDGRHLRYVGNPAPDGYNAYYQWGEPFILTTSPEDGPVTMAGTLDLSDMDAAGQVAVIGLHDADMLEAGDRGEKAEAGIYVAWDGSDYTIGVTDGDAGGGEFVQRFTETTLSTVDVEFVVDGTIDPATCASDAADVGTADGCMTLTVNGTPISDSYGSISPDGVDTELGNGGNPGWYSAYPSGHGPDVGVDFDLVVSPIVPTAPGTADDCKNGGFSTFDFKNQGLCVASVKANENAGK